MEELKRKKCGAREKVEEQEQDIEDYCVGEFSHRGIGLWQKLILKRLLLPTVNCYNLH